MAKQTAPREAAISPSSGRFQVVWGRPPACCEALRGELEAGTERDERARRRRPQRRGHSSVRSGGGNGGVGGVREAHQWEKVECPAHTTEAGGGGHGVDGAHERTLARTRGSRRRAAGWPRTSLPLPCARERERPVRQRRQPPGPPSTSTRTTAGTRSVDGPMRLTTPAWTSASTSSAESEYGSRSRTNAVSRLRDAVPRHSPSLRSMSARYSQGICKGFVDVDGCGGWRCCCTS
jgi:hypothetical protein